MAILQPESCIWTQLHQRHFRPLFMTGEDSSKMIWLSQEKLRQGNMYIRLIIVIHQRGWVRYSKLWVENYIYQ